MTTKYRLFIGSNNVTKELESLKAFKLLEAFGVGAFSAFEQMGYWNGQPEKSLVVDIIDFEGAFKATIATIARQIAIELEQDAVMVETLDTDAQLIQGVAR